MGKNYVIRNKRSGKAQAFFFGKDGKRPLLQKLLLLLMVLVLLVAVYLVYRDASSYEQQGQDTPAASVSVVP